MAIIGKINNKVFIDDLVFREKESKEIKWLSGGRQQGKTYQLIKDQQKEIERLNKGFEYLEKYFSKPNKFIERPERMKILDKLKELKEGKNNHEN